MQPLPRYDWRQTYEWNFEHAPPPVKVDEPDVPGRWTYCGIPVGSPLAVAAGPLLNGRWCRYYASLGFDTVTYKTVRSTARVCYPLPNLQPVANESLDGTQPSVPSSADFDGSWAVSFGMPSKPPETWQADIAETRHHLPPHKLLSVSVVGTMQAGWSLERLAADYADCARQAVESGADVVELNLSCPNVTSCDGQLYQLPIDAAIVAKAVRHAVRDKSMVAKIGFFHNAADIPRLVDALTEHVTAIAATNCIATHVTGDDGRPMFEGQQRGIGGSAILDASVRQAEAIANHIARRNLPTRVLGVGGAFTAADMQRYLSAGCEAIQLATAAMINPMVAIEIRKAMAGA